MIYLDGTQIAITTFALNTIVGKKITYLRKIDISGRGYFFPRYGVVDEVCKKTIVISGDFLSFSELHEIVLYEN